jgi:hypothetical protein
MKDSKQKKYLGDQLNHAGKIKETINERVSKGFGIVNEIVALIEEIPLGKYRL